MSDTQSVKNRFGIIGSSPALNYAIRVAMQVANTDLPVLIMGESGVGKEAFSQIIHSLSSRKHNPFIAVNCGAIPEGTIDSELFGHEKGSFTGAVENRKGYFETVNGGTIFLDEIGEMPVGTQARLLRVLETGEYIRVGSSKVQKTDVRIITATNKNLLELTQAGKFREDLYYRLNTVPIRVPPLRERKEDIPLLFRKFCVDFAERYRVTPIQLTAEAQNMLANYPWPGNIRELKNMAEQVSVLSKEKVVQPEELRHFLPDENKMLPVLANTASRSEREFSSERDLLYKLFFDMKKDVTELKKMFFDMLRNPQMAREVAYEHGYSPERLEQHYPYQAESYPYSGQHSPEEHAAIPAAQPIILSEQDKIDQHEEVEDSLSIADKEKELIAKALKKHRGKRKDAAMDLGISERTLYRKLKEYHINE
jgi:DNA-binding NtrC family response regulator